MLAQARTDVAMKTRFTSLSFESVKFIALFNDWWDNHGSRTRSKFEYRTPRILSRFSKKKAREITPDAVRGFLADLKINDWWDNHGSRTRSKFVYRTPRILSRFSKKKAREITPDAVRGFLADL